MEPRQSHLHAMRVEQAPPLWSPRRVNATLPFPPTHQRAPVVPREWNGPLPIRVMSSYPRGSQSVASATAPRSFAAPQQRAVSVSTSAREVPYVISPSRLRYVAVSSGTQVSPRDLLRGWSAGQLLHHTPRVGALEAAKSPRSPTTSILQHAPDIHAAAPVVSPLLQQALLLIEAAEVEERLAFSQEEAEDFESFHALLSVAKEVEVVRVAAFEMFHIERAARRALRRQEKHERKVALRWCKESRADALLFEEVRILQSPSEALKRVSGGSLLRSRSPSLQRHVQTVFQPSELGLTQDPSSHSRRPATSPAIAAPGQTACKVQDDSSRTSSSHDGQLHVASGEPSSTPSRYCASRSVSPPRSPHRTSDSVSIAGERGWWHEGCSDRQSAAVVDEVELEDRIFKQGALLAPLSHLSRERGRRGFCR